MEIFELSLKLLIQSLARSVRSFTPKRVILQLLQLHPCATRTTYEEKVFQEKKVVAESEISINKPEP